MIKRRFGLAVALAALGTLVLAPGAQAARGSAPDGTYVVCNGSSLNYIMVAGAPIYVWSYANMPANPGAATAIECSTAGEGPGVNPWHPTAEGVYAQGWSGGAAVGPVYAVVGGAPLPAAAGASAGHTVEPFDNASLPGTTDQTTVGGTPVYGMFSSVVRNGYFRGSGGTYYHTDYAGHPIILPKAPANHTSPVVDQGAINACQRMNCDPWGDISVEVAGEGRIHVSGYALDGFATRPLTVHLDAAGQAVDLVANQPNAAINAGYGIAGNYGFDRVVSVPAGHYDLCTTFVGYAPGGTTEQAGCQAIVVPGAKPGKVHRPKLKATGHGRALVRWKVPITHGSPITEYVVKVGHRQKQVSGTAHRVVLKHLPVGRSVTVKVRAINGVGLGKYSKASRAVRIR
ncbi:fibronectin type III domain-containing protein [Nocardioides sp. BP30]|uniref:fibronectin type III domain-containing protein n=1 Tax=Nocardioides sp. BP30 TaxID=3036374 RepID=UPI0024699E20|nr:fibronectin type III domain-containing protein [Nocardioides sp. BP30]WGL51542.1 fibronectin type III domain-containing protein [Nocardioides sp. BP30]